VISPEIVSVKPAGFTMLSGEDLREKPGGTFIGTTEISITLSMQKIQRISRQLNSLPGIFE